MAKLLLAVAVILATYCSSMAATYNHPGLYSNRSDIEFFTAKVKEGTSPWKSGYEKVKSQSSVYKGATHAWEIYRYTDTWHEPGPQVDLMKDSYAAYGFAIQWLVTRNSLDAEEAIRHINAWAYKLKSIASPSASKLPASWSFPGMVTAAELLAHTYPGYKQADIDQFRKMLLTLVYPVVRVYTNSNNWKSFQNHLCICIGIFCDNKTIIDEALPHLIKQIPAYISESGKSDETCRDMRHSQMGIAPLVGSAEIMWKQGMDVYSTANNRLLAGAEYHAGIILGDNIEPAPGCTINERDFIWPYYEMICNHYTFRMKIPAPASARLVSSYRPEQYHRTGWGTLLHNQLPGGNKPWPVGTSTALSLLPPRVAMLNDAQPQLSINAATKSVGHNARPSTRYYLMNGKLIEQKTQAVSTSLQLTQDSAGTR